MEDLVASPAQSKIGASLATRTIKKGEKCRCGKKPIATLDIYVADILISTVPFCAECASTMDINVYDDFKVELNFLRQA